MPKEKPESVVEGATPSLLAPATYKLVNLQPNQEYIHIPHLGREYYVKDLESNPGLLELLDRIGWPHVEKTI